MHIFKRKDSPNWYLKRKAADGKKWVVRSLRTDDRRKAQGILAQLQGEEGKPQTAPFDWEALEAFYVTWATPRKAAKTISGRVYSLRRFAEFMGAAPPSKIELRHVEDFAIKYRQKAGNNTVNQRIAALSSIWNLAIKHNKLVGPSPFCRFDKLPALSDEVEYLTDAQCASLLAAAHVAGRDIHLFIALGIFAGLRKGEALAARWDWFDRETRSMRVKPLEGGWQPKGGKARSIPIAGALASILSVYYSESEANRYLIAPYTEPKPGKLYRIDNRKKFNSTCKAAGVKIHFHGLRHTFAARHCQNGTDLYRISKWLGHANIHTTQRYAHLCPEDGAIDLAALPAPPK